MLARVQPVRALGMVAESGRLRRCAELLANEKAAIRAEFEKSRILLAGGTARQRRAWDFWTLRNPRKI